MGSSDDHFRGNQKPNSSTFELFSALFLQSYDHFDDAIIGIVGSPGLSTWLVRAGLFFDSLIIIIISDSRQFLLFKAYFADFLSYF
jgi:hypothetical protein